jgi:hypothetical protein
MRSVSALLLMLLLGSTAQPAGEVAAAIEILGPVKQ